LELLDHFWINEWYDSRAHEQRRKREAVQALTKWFESEGIKATPAFWVEQDFSLQIGGYKLHGRIDRADKLADGSLEIIDYKTGRLKDPKKQQKNNQLALYALAAQQAYKQRVSKMSWYFLDEGVKVSTTRTKEELADYEQEVLGNIKSILASDFIPTPGFNCRFCDFKNICVAGQAGG
ncbi:MAG: PD-(D/E)XK nuclease family protein, partial [bacterium]|nr:PD-(D/E)XK nuclease family protein [bacterium]